MTAPLRLVVDTNVLVSALLHPGRTPDLALSAVVRAGCVVLHDPRLVAEWREVLSRRKLRAIEPERAARRIDALLAAGEPVEAPAAYEGPMIDAGDRPFVEVALAGRAHGIVTGNTRHYPEDLGFAVLTPAALLARLPAPDGRA